MLYSFFKFFKHYLNATPIDVLHSPFIFGLYNSCIAKQKYPSELLKIQIEWEKNLSNQSLIEQKDFGALGLKDPIKIKTVSFFAKKSAKPKRLAHLIYNIVKHYKYQNCIELGTSLGYTTMHIAKALPSISKFTTIEGAPDIAKQAIYNFKQTNLANLIDVKIGNFDDLLPEVLSDYKTIDFAFIDGNHTYEATMSYFFQLLAKKNNQTLLIFDDIYWSRGMTKAWEEIKLQNEVTVTVDLFFIGLVYFKRDQRKQNFRLRLF